VFTTTVGRCTDAVNIGTHSAFSTDLPDSFQECRNLHTWNA